MAAALVVAAFVIAAIPESKISYSIDVKLEPEARKLIGEEVIRWTNPSTTAIDRLRMHLYLNGFAHEHTTWMSEELGPGELDGLLEIQPDPWGWIELKEIRQRSGDLRITLSSRPIQPDDGNTLDRSLIEIDLASPIPPGEATELEVAFEARLPHIIARTGVVLDFYSIAQWYPKIGVLETPGVRGAKRTRWAARQFHAQTEFYADFADYNVRIEAPEEWLVAATGQRVKVEGTRHHFVQRGVHDFAWATAPDLEEVEQIIQRSEPITVRYVGPPGTKRIAEQMMPWTELFFEVLEKRAGEYPYRTLTIVLPTPAAMEAGGMEYPTFIYGAAPDRLYDVMGYLVHPSVIAHELAHQWFYGIVATHEVDEAFLDEGVTTYFEGELVEAGAEKFGVRHTTLGRRYEDMLERLLPLARGADRIDGAMVQRPSFLISRAAYLQIYTRLPTCLGTIERRFGQQALDAFFQAYYRRFAFRHPSAEDFLSCGDVLDPRASALLAECVRAEKVPNFEVLSLDSDPYDPPEGEVIDVLRVTDPGHTRGAEVIEGRVELRPISPGSVERETFLSEATIRGPGLDHLPVTVELRFDDGVVISEVWDAKARERSYRVVRRARLSEAVIDPEAHLVLDVKPTDDGLRAEANAALVDDWAAFWSALASWLARGALVWL